MVRVPCREVGYRGTYARASRGSSRRSRAAAGAISGSALCVLLLTSRCVGKRRYPPTDVRSRSRTGPTVCGHPARWPALSGVGALGCGSPTLPYSHEPRAARPTAPTTGARSSAIRSLPLPRLRVASSPGGRHLPLAEVGQLELAHDGDHARASAGLGPRAGQVARGPIPRGQPSAI
jgi:hypothetical protein